MNNKIEVNEYVRTDKGKITKIIGIDEFIDSTTFYETEDNPGYMDLCNKNIVKHSKQLINVLEKGDIIITKDKKVYKFYDIKKEKIYCEDSLADDTLIRINIDEVSMILTKEQLKANCYKVGGEDEQI